MTLEEAINWLRTLHSVSDITPGAREALVMAISALEKEKEPAPQEAETSSSKNNSISNDNTKLKECQEVVKSAAAELIEYYGDQLSPVEQKAWDLGEIYRKVLDAQNLFEEAMK